MSDQTSTLTDLDRETAATQARYSRIVPFADILRVVNEVDAADRSLNWIPCIQIGETLWKSQATGD